MTFLYDRPIAQQWQMLWVSQSFYNKHGYKTVYCMWGLTVRKSLFGDQRFDRDISPIFVTR